jgi:hypothetical protein
MPTSDEGWRGTAKAVLMLLAVAVVIVGTLALMTLAADADRKEDRCAPAKEYLLDGGRCRNDSYRMSFENGVVMCRCVRIPSALDPGP